MTKLVRNAVTASFMIEFFRSNILEIEQRCVIFNDEGFGKVPVMIGTTTVGRGNDFGDYFPNVEKRMKKR